MRHDDSKFNPRNTAAESVFIRSNKEMVMSRVNELVASRSLIHTIPSAENLMPSKEQIAVAMQSTRAVETSPVTAAAGLAVAQAEKADFEESSRLAVESSYTPESDTDQTPAAAGAAIHQFPRANTGPEVAAASKTVADAYDEAA